MREGQAKVAESVMQQGQGFAQWAESLLQHQQHVQAHPEDLAAQLAVFFSLHQRAVRVLISAWKEKAACFVSDRVLATG